MKAIVVYYSLTGNTRKVANVFSKELKCKAVDIVKEKPKLSGYNLVFIGTGIYKTQMPVQIRDFVNNISKKEARSKRFVVFGTYGSMTTAISGMKRILESKGAKVIGEFGCKGQDEYWLFKIFNINRGRPNAKDLENAREFVRGLMKR